MCYFNDKRFALVINHKVGTDMSEEAAGHHGRFSLTRLQFGEEVVAVEVMQLF